MIANLRDQRARFTETGERFGANWRNGIYSNLIWSTTLISATNLSDGGTHVDVPSKLVLEQVRVKLHGNRTS